MKIAFFGTPELASVYLEALASRYEVCGVVTQPDKARGRSGALTPSPVKQIATHLGMEILQPEKGECPKTCQCIQEHCVDLCVVVAFGQKLPCGGHACSHGNCINVHYSLLPQLRGAAPVQHAILQGLEKTGITIQHVGPGWDEGDIVLQREIDINPNETTGELFERLTQIGPQVLLDAIEIIEQGCDPGLPQDDARATFAPMIRKEDGVVDWSENSTVIARKVMAYNPWPAAQTIWRGKPLKILRAKTYNIFDIYEGKPGYIRELTEDEGLAVQCGEGVLLIQELQLAGRKPVSAVEFVRGARLQPGDCFGDISPL